MASQDKTTTTTAEPLAAPAEASSGTATEPTTAPAVASNSTDSPKPTPVVCVL